MPLLQLVPSRVCLQCDVCCRFPEAESFLRPYFTAEEIQRAVARGINPAHFSDPNGSQVSVVPNPSGEGYLCPAFDPATSHCRIYDDRPLDCQIYPLAVMWNQDHSQVVLGWDTKCPFMRDAVPSEILAYARTITTLLEREDVLTTVASSPRLIGRFQEDVVILNPLLKLTARVRAGFEVQGSRFTAPTSNIELRTLHPLTLADRPRFECALKSVETPLAHYALAPHLIWMNLFRYSWAELAGHMCLLANYADGMYMPLPPLGVKPHREAFAQAFALMRETNKGSAVSRIENVPDEWRAALESWGYRLKPKDPDYLYRTADLAALAGDRYKSQRAACNRFEREHRHAFEPYRDSDRDACLTLFREWAAQKQAAGLEEVGRHMLADSESAHREAFTHHRELGLIGHVVRVDGTVRAYTFGYERSSSVLCVLLEVADRTIAGLAPFIFREFCREAAAGSSEFVNTMDDSGLPSLAHAKRTYHPIRLVPSYIVMEA
jgi:Fe-S-cluster containining protein